MNQSFWRDPRAIIGITITLLIVALAIVGPWLAPYGENEIVGSPFSTEGSFLGTDYLGQDVLSRVLYGGRSILVTAVLATIVGVLVGAVLGIIAAYFGGWLDEIIMRLGDVFLALPQILLTLLVLSAVKEPSMWIIVLLVGFTFAPRIARVIRGVAIPYTHQDFIVSAEVLGESRWRILFSELLPNITVALLAEAGLRLTYSIGMIAGIAFLGFSSQPGAADWGQMTNENRLALLVQPWGVLAPVFIIALFTIGTNMIADGIARRAAKGRS